MVTATSLEPVLARLDAIQAELVQLRGRQHESEELWSELMPIARAAMDSATTKLEALDGKGYFAFGGALLGVLDRIVQNYSPSDVEQLADAIVQILDTVRAATQPEVMALAADAAAAAGEVDKVEPLGIFGLARATRNPDVGRGIAVMVERD